MYLIYVDESGVIHGGNREGRYYVLAATLVPDANWRTIDNNVTNIKTRNFPDKSPNALEIHVYDIANNKRAFVYTPLVVKMQFLQDIYALINQSPLKIISVVIRKPEFEELHPNLDIEHNAWKLLLERVEMYLSEYNSNGLIIMDSRCPESDDHIRKIVGDLRQYGTYFVAFQHLIEDIFFTKSNLRNLTQLADAIAFCTRQHMRNSQPFAQYWDLIEPKFHRDASGRILGYGLKIYP